MLEGKSLVTEAKVVNIARNPCPHCDETWACPDEQKEAQQTRCLDMQPETNFSCFRNTIVTPRFFPDDESAQSVFYSPYIRGKTKIVLGDDYSDVFLGAARGVISPQTVSMEILEEYPTLPFLLSDQYESFFKNILETARLTRLLFRTRLFESMAMMAYRSTCLLREPLGKLIAN